MLASADCPIATWTCMVAMLVMMIMLVIKAGSITFAYSSSLDCAMSWRWSCLNREDWHARGIFFYFFFFPLFPLRFPSPFPTPLTLSAAPALDAALTSAKPLNPLNAEAQKGENMPCYI